MMACDHQKTRVLYQQTAPSEGRTFKAVKARVCVSCGAVIA